MICLVLRLIDTLCNSMVDCPLPYLLVVAAHPGRAVVRPWVAIVERKAEWEYVDVGLAHNELSKRIDAVVEMSVQVFGLRSRVATELGVVSLPVGLSEQVQAMQLVEDFNSDSVSTFAGCRVGHHESSLRVHVHLDHFFSSDHGVWDYTLVSWMVVKNVERLNIPPSVAQSHIASTWGPLPTNGPSGIGFRSK